MGFPDGRHRCVARTSPAGRPAAYVTRDGGDSWQRQSRGMPQDNAWWTVYRQAMAHDTCDSVGVYFGTSSGSLWMSADEGENWSMIAQHLPPIYAVEVAARD